MFILLVFVYTTCVPGAHWDQEMALDSMEQWLWVIVGSHVGSARAASTLNHEVTLQSLKILTSRTDRKYYWLCFVKNKKTSAKIMNFVL